MASERNEKNRVREAENKEWESNNTNQTALAEQRPVIGAVKCDSSTVSETWHTHTRTENHQPLVPLSSFLSVQPCVLSPTLTHTPSFSHLYLSLIQTYWHACYHTHTQPNSFSHTHANTPTYTHTLSPSWLDIHTALPANATKELLPVPLAHLLHHTL